MYGWQRTIGGLGEALAGVAVVGAGVAVGIAAVPVIGAAIAAAPVTGGASLGIAAGAAAPAALLISGGGVIAWHGITVGQSGFYNAITGEDTDTWLSQHMQQNGVSREDANRIDNALSIIGSLASTAACSPSLDMKDLGVALDVSVNFDAAVNLVVESLVKGK